MYVHERHDIGIVRTDGTKVGLMLARDREAPIYRTYQDKYLVQQRYSAAPDYGALDPENEIRMIGTDHRSGFGQEYFSSKDPYRYYSSRGMDGRFKGMFIPGPTPTAIVLNTYPGNVTIPNANMEADSSWLGGGERSSAKSAGGTYSWMVVGGNSSYQTLFTDNKYAKTTWQFRCNVNASDASTGMLRIVNGETNYNSTYHVGDGSWDLITLTTKFSNAPTKLEVHLFAATTNNVYFDDMEILIQPHAGVIPAYCHATFNDNEYIGRGNILEKLSTLGDAFTVVNTFPVNVLAGAYNISCLEKFTDSKLYIANNVYSYWEMTAAEAFTKNNLNVLDMQYMKTVHTTVDTMYANNSANEVWSTAAPKAGGTNWASKVTVGALDDEITCLLSKDAEIHIMKEDKPYYISSGGNAHSNTAPILETLKSPTSGKNSIEYLGKLYIPAGQQALLEVGDYKTWRTPAERFTNLPEFVGRVQALAHDDQWLYAVLANTGYGVEVLACREEDIEGSREWVIHPIAEVPIANCETAWVSSIYQKRLWITSTDGGESIYYIPLYSGYGDVLNDVNAKFKTNTWMITPYLHGGFRGDNKGFPELELTLGHAYNADVLIQSHYQKLGDTVWTAIANYSGNATHRLQSNYLPDAGTVHPVSTMMRFKFTAHTKHTDLAPILSSYDPKGWLYPKVRNIIECEVRCADGILDKEGNQLEEASAEYIRDTIEEAQDATWPFTIYDLWGDSHTVRVLPTPTFSYALAHQKDENPEERFILRLQEVSVA